MRRLPPVFVMSILVLVAVPVLGDFSPDPFDPLAAGPHATNRPMPYDFGTERVGEPGELYEVPVRGVLHHPKEPGPSASLPVVVLLHGGHASCGVDALNLAPLWWPQVDADCMVRPAIAGNVLDPIAIPGFGNYSNHLGYDYLGTFLASHGYVVASVDANAIYTHHGNRGNTSLGMLDRGQLLLRTLDELERVNESLTPPFGVLKGKLDLTRVGLMGHSLGGTGVVAALDVNDARPVETRHHIRAVHSLAPFVGDHAYVPRDVAFATLLPSCDGDVSTMDGAKLFDRSRFFPESVPSPKVQIVVMGADHNIYNSKWAYGTGHAVSGDDTIVSTNPFCALPSEVPGGGRLTVEEQRNGALLYVAGFFRWTLGDDARLAPWFTGEASSPPAAVCPGLGLGPCPDAVHVSYAAPHGDRLVVEDFKDEVSLRENNLGGETTLEGFLAVDLCPGCPGPPSFGESSQFQLNWSGPSVYRTRLPSAHEDISTMTSLSVRVAVPYAAEANLMGQDQDFRMELVDAHGQTSSVLVSDFSTAAYYPPVNPVAGNTTVPPEVHGLHCYVGMAGYKCIIDGLFVNQARVPLSAFEGVDLTAIREIALQFDVTRAGPLRVTDLVVQRES